MIFGCFMPKKEGFKKAFTLLFKKEPTKGVILKKLLFIILFIVLISSIVSAEASSFVGFKCG